MDPPTSTALIPVDAVKKEPVAVNPEEVEAVPSRYHEAGKINLQKARRKTFQELTTEQKLLAIVRHSVKPFSDRLDPFAALPVNLDRLQEHLISFYLLYYPKATYGFSPRLRPHPVASNFSIALTTPACFQVILARSALYRIGLNKYASDREKDELNMAVIRHKGEALKLVRGLSTTASPNRKDDLLASIISLGTFDRRNGAQDAAGMHYSAVRRILKSTGGPLAVNSVLLSRVMCFFECIYGTSPESYIWDESDLKRLVKGLNGFLLDIRKIWLSLSNISGLTAQTAKPPGPVSIHSFGLQPGSALLSLVERQPPADAELTQGRRLEMIFQVTCLLTLGMVVLDSANDFRSLQQYMDGLHKQMADLQLVGQSCNNAMWQMQVDDHSDVHSRRIWRAASFAWVLKHVSYNVQLSLKEWLLAFFKGQLVADKQFRLDPFHFSYAN
ncbi:hypothetical protein LTR47_003771 [Exophiala xenobiotica]|nr:hypothetical protein LTR41_002083 [Exophiala xenobiotica]KAK5234936.1 hypothetical protein LTR47_003771 [Exophiala xenobiotica]KAK5251938.1 hypothetical protein LTS06_003450 [Exophiala xenobiotica]KAK5261575.1 hypothetical protein LTR40_001923 [Exophiala xenobiotica]KAK5346799.1 hypothetical protein LTR61_009495 [Exophiala xenobiotica]